MRPFFVNVQRERNAGFAQCVCEHEAVFHENAVVLGSVPDEAWRCVFSDVQFVREFFEQLRGRILAEKIFDRALMSMVQQRDHGITKDAEIRTRALALDGIVGIRFTRVKVGHQCGSKVAARGRADDADAFGIDLPFGSAGADRAERASRILQHNGMAIAGRAEAVLQHEPCDTVFTEKARVVFTFVRRQAPIRAAGADDQRCARRFAFLGQKDRKRGDVFGFCAKSAGSIFVPERKRQVIGGFGLKKKAYGAQKRRSQNYLHRAEHNGSRARLPALTVLGQKPHSARGQ